MYVKKIVLKNFKSFASATVLLEPGFVAFVGPNGSGKCVRGDTDVILGDGSVVSAGEFVESKLAASGQTLQMDDGVACLNTDGVEVFSLNPQKLKMERKKVQAFVKRKSPEELCEVTTRAGRKIVSTTYHPVLTLKDGAVAALKAEELKPGMFVATPRKLEVAGEKFYPRLELLKLNLPIYFTDSESKLKTVLTELKAKRGLSWRNLAEEAGVPFQVLNSFVCGQAIKLFFAARLAEYAGLNDFEKTNLFSRVKAKNQRKQVSILVELDERFARFLGLVISEGRIIKNEVFFYNDAPEIRSEFSRLSKELFDCDAVECLSHGKPFLILPSAPIILLLEHLFRQKPFTHSSKKIVPKPLMTAPDNVVAAFVSSLFDGDGSVSRSSDSKVCLEYVSASKQLAKQLVYLFLRLGVVARFSSAEKFASNTVAKTRREYYRVCVYGLENVFALQNKLSFAQADKAKRFQELLVSTKKPATAVDVIPANNALIKKFLQENNFSNRKLKKIKPSKIRAYFEDRCMPTRGGLKQVLELVAANNAKSETAVARNWLETLSSSDVFWDEIKSVTKISGEEWVYDLTVEENHNFLAEGMFVHNTNLIDSLLFCFGESSLKAMRVKRTSDLIHAAHPYAEVHVFLEDAGGKTTEIRRAIRRDGKAKYWLNGKRVKKYVVDDFLAANRISLQNVIKQGEVQRIVEMNSKDRRAIIDFVANVAEYEAKKQEALGELEKVEARLREARVLTAEREGYLRELEQDKKNAEKFVVLDEKRKRLKATLLWLDLAELEREFETAVNLLLDSENKRGALGKEIALLDERISAEHAAQDVVNKKISERTSGRAEKLQKRIEELVITINTEGVVVDTRKDAAAKAEARAADLRREKIIAGDEARGADSQLKQLITEYDSVKRVVDAETAAVAALNKQSESFSQSFKKARETLDSANAAILDCKTKLATLQAEIGKQQEVKALKQKELERLRTGEGIEDYAAKRRALEIESKEEAKRLKAFQSEVEKLVERESEFDKRIEALNDLILAARQRIAEKEALLRAAGEGGGAGSRTTDALRDLRETVKGVHGTVAEICSYSSKHALPIAVALGNRLNYVVVDDVATAGKCIEYLKQTKSGHASFIPLKQIHNPPKIERALLKEKGVEGEIKDFLKYDERFERAIAFACGSTLLVESFAVGERLVGEARMVTREGELFEASGLVSGGHLTPKANPFLEARELKEWNEKRDDAEREKQEKLALLEQTRQALREARRRAAESELKLKTIEIHAQNVERIEEEALRKKTDLRQALRALEEEARACDDAVAAAEEERGGVVRRISELNVAIVEAKQVMDVEKEERFGSSIKEREHKLGELRVELSKKEAEAKTLRARKDVYDKQLEKATRELASVEEEEAKARRELADSNDKIKAARAELEEKAREQKQISSALEDLIGEREEIDERIRVIGNEKGKLQLALEKIGREENDARVRKGIAETRLGDVKADFEPFKSVPLLEKKTSADKPALGAELRVAQEQIDALGTINLKAIEDYARRAGELEEQRLRVEQLGNEKQAVLAIIAEVEGKKKDTFMNAFNAVNENFKRLFKHVFSGEGSLVLENPDSPFEAGLTIKAQLESKQIKYLELMSGGEKSFVALLFLFAVQACNPSSVYVLDEADAALDQHNSLKLAELLRKLARTTQFIVVTHNEDVYKAAEALVGVSMARGGSQIVEVKLEDAKEGKETKPK